MTDAEYVAMFRAEREASRLRAMAEPIHDAASFLEAAGHTDRNNGPQILLDCLYSRRIARADLAAVVAYIWSGAEYPQRSFGVRKWCELFRMAGYPRPAAPLTIYRGATPGRARGMAWTTALDMARLFADRFGTFADGSGRFRPAYVYTVTAPPEAVLAIMDDVEPDGRLEHEVVVDPRRLPKVSRLPEPVPKIGQP